MIVTMLHWLIKELIKAILQMLLLLINWLHLSLPILGWHGSASPTGVMYRTSGPNTGSNSGGGRILKKILYP